MLAEIANIVSAIILLVTAIIMAFQIREMRRATYATTFKAIYDMLQAEDIRNARKIVLNKLADKPFESWTDEEKKVAEKVCSNYDAVGIIMRNGLIPVKFIADSWGYSLRRTWRILSPMVASYRMQRNSKEFWDDYEWLAEQAAKYKKVVYEEN